MENGAAFDQPAVVQLLARIGGAGNSSPDRLPHAHQQRCSRVTAAAALRTLAARTAVPALTLAASADPDRFVRRQSLWAVAELAPDKLPEIVAAVQKSKYPEHRIALYQDLLYREKNIEPPVPLKLAVPHLIEGLKDQSPNITVRLAIISELRDLGPAAKEAIPALAESAHNDRATAVRKAAKSAISKIQGK